MKYMRDCAEHQPEIDPDTEKADIPDGPGNGQIIQNKTQKLNLALENWRP